MPYSNISLVTDPNLLFQQYDFIQLSHDENNYIIGRVVSYNINSGELVFTPIQVNGSGTYDSWKISLTGSPGPSGTSGISSLVPGVPNSIVKINSDGTDIETDGNLTFDGHTLTIDPFSYSTGGTPVFRVVYHNDGTAGTAGIVVRGAVPGQPYDGIIENRVPRQYQHQFVVGGNNIAHIDNQGLHVQQALIADNGIYFEGLEEGDSETKFLVWDNSTSGDGLIGNVKWKSSSGTPGPQGESGTSGTSGYSGESGTSGSSGTSGLTDLLASTDWNISTDNYLIKNTEQLTFSGDYVLNNSVLYIEGSNVSVEYAQGKSFKKIGKIFIGGSLLVEDSVIVNNGFISVGGEIILKGASQILGNGIIT
jgi:hypothetical protein